MSTDVAAKQSKSSGRRSKKAYKVEISWVDATGHTGWQSVDEAMDRRLVLMHTLGYLIDSNDKFVKMVRSVEDGGNDVGDVFTIPRDWVQRIKRLK